VPEIDHRFQSADVREELAFDVMQTDQRRRGELHLAARFEADAAAAVAGEQHQPAAVDIGRQPNRSARI
jgi:hypothetical protein